MQSHSLCTTNNSRNLAQSGFVANSSVRSTPLTWRFSIDYRKFNRHSYINRKLVASRVRRNGSRLRQGVFRVRAMDDDSGSLSDWGDSSIPVGYMYSSSEGEESDGDIILQPITDVDLPTSKEQYLPADDSITMTAHRLGMLGRARKKRKTLYGVLNNVGVVSFSTILILLVDQCAWRIVRLPLAPFHLMRPFLISVILVSCVGYICVPLFRIWNLQSVNRKLAPAQLKSKKGTPTMGGLYFVPIGLLVTEALLGLSSTDVSGVVAATIAFAGIGLLDDLLSLNTTNGLPGWMRTLLEVAVGCWFSYWLYTTDISTPYSMKMVVPLPAPLGLVCLGRFYPVLTSLCFVSMANGINKTNGLDGLAAGTAALAFIGMSIVVLPICSDLATFGASMAGACVGFLFQNRYRASIFMGETGALAVGGALAAMASHTGMFFPLFISSGIFFLEAISVFLQVFLFKATKYFGQKKGYRLFRMAPFHYHLQLCGITEPAVVAAAYVVTCFLIICAAYVGLSSA